MAEYDRAVGTWLAVGNASMGTMVEDYAVNETLNDAGTFVLVGCYHAIYCGRHIHIQCAGKEGTACAEYQLCGDERTFYGAEWTGLADKTFRLGR